MNYRRELLALYAGKDALTQKYVLAQLGDADAGLDSPEVASLLWRELTATNTAVRRQARFTLGEYLPRHVAHGFGVPAAEDAANAAGQEALEPAIRAALAVVDAPEADPAHVAMAWVLAGRLRTPAHVAALGERLQQVPLNLDAALALADAGGEAAVAALRQAARQHGAQRSDLFLALRGLSDAETLALLHDEEPRLSGYARMNLALALSAHAPAARRELLARLVERREGWVTAAALDSLACNADAEDLALVRRAYELESHEFVRFQAVRAAGTIESPDALRFCLDRLEDGSPRVQSAALEALGHHPAHPDLARLAARHLESEFLRSRVHATLIVGRHDPARALASVEQFALSQEPLLRLEAAFMLGELQGPASVPLLARMAAEDSADAVRQQAVASLARFGAPAGGPHLVRIAEAGDPALARLALRALGHAGPLPAGLLSDAIHAVEKRALPAERGVLLPPLCMLLASAGRIIPPVAVAALGAEDDTLTLGALEGLKRFGDQVSGELVNPFLAHAHPRIRARAAQCRLLAGDAAGAEVLAQLAASADGAAFREAASALIELATLGPALAPIARFRGFAALGRAPAGAPAGAGRSTRGTRKLAMPVAPVVLAAPPAAGATAPEPTMVRLYRPTGVHQSLPVGEHAVPATGELRAPTGWADRSSMRVLVPRPRLGDRLRPRAAQALAVVLAAAGLAWLVAGRSTAPPSGSAPEHAGSMRVWALKGRATARAPRRAEQALHAGDRVRPGSALTTDATGSLELRDAAGNAVRLGAASALTLGPAAPAAGQPRYEAAGANGTLTLDFHAEALALVHLDAGDLALVHGVVEVSSAGGAAHGTLRAGAATLTRPGQRARQLAAGDRAE